MAKNKKSYSRRSGASATGSCRTRENEEISTLEARIEMEAPNKGYAPPLHQMVSFRALPLSEATLRGLEEATKKFTTMTAIQNACIPHALAGRDVLGAAKTGSGKTLAYLIPLIEKLYRARHVSKLDGPGAIVLSPTRELAVQIFEVLRRIGSFHALSAGLLVGGKHEFALEQARVGAANILISTPGRLLQHLEQTPSFHVDELKMLVLDEADRILDMGFREQMLRILEYLPLQRQTLLFSATQTKRVSDLAALSLKRPEYIGVHDKETTATPESLQQSMIVIPLQHKLDAVYSFIKSHLKKKAIVFFSSCSQVRHANQLFCAMQPGIPLLALHGKINQEKRTKIYFDFLHRPHAVLLATDVAARGLDFPNVDWVVQADAPEDVAMYIHRVGRTARYNAGGRSVLCVLPSEQAGMMTGLLNAKIPIKKLSINPLKTTVLVSQRASSIVASNPDFNSLAKKAFKSYLRSIHLMPNKEIFDLTHLLPELDEYATSLGLASAPGLRFVKEVRSREDLRGKKNVNRKLQTLKEKIRAEKLQKKLKDMGSKGTVGLKVDRMKRKHGDGDDDEDNLLILKEKTHAGKGQEMDATDSVEEEKRVFAKIHEVTKSRYPKRIRIEGSTVGDNKRIVFNEDGEELEDVLLSGQPLATPTNPAELEDANMEYMRRVKERLRISKERDRVEEKHRIREKHKRQKTKEKSLDNETTGDTTTALLGGNEDADGHLEGFKVKKRSDGDADASSEDVDVSEDDDPASEDDENNGDDNTGGDDTLEKDKGVGNEQCDADFDSAGFDSDDDDSNNGEIDVQTQEALALALIRKKL